MPIYAYRCDACGFQQDVLQKISDPRLVVCPSCGAPAFQKQVTAAGFQLKGSGWYVTDFRNPGTKEAAKGSGGDAGDGGKPDAGKADQSAAGADKSAPTPAPASTPAATSDAKPAPAAGGGSTG